MADSIGQGFTGGPFGPEEGHGGASAALSLDALKTLRIGDWVASGAKGSAVAFATTMNHYSDGQLGLLSIFGGSEANLTSAYNVHVARFRHLVSAATATGTTAMTAAQETYGAVGQVVAKYATLTHLHAGLMGTFEGNTAGVVLNSSYSIGHAGVIARIGGHAAITATTPLAAFLAFNNASAALGSGSSAAFGASSASASYPFVYGLYLPAGSVANGISLSATTTGIASTVTALAAAGIGHSFYVTVSAPNNQSGMAAYFDVTINGTTAGHCYGLGSWINTGATSPVLAAGHIIVPFEGGVYTGEAQASARIVFGGQFQAVLGGAPATLHAFRLNTNQTITALIAAGNSGSVGYTAGTGAGTALGWMALADIAGGVGVVYVKVYSATA